MDNMSRIARKITATLFATHSLAKAAYITSGTVSVIAAAQLSGNPAWAGLPSSMMQLTSAFAALGVAASTDRLGRRRGLGLGLLVGVLGAGLGVGAIVTGNFALLLGGSVLLGVASAATSLARFAAAEVHPPERRGRAISRVVLGGVVASVVGPLLVGPSGRWTLQLGMNELLGPYLVTLAILPLAVLAIFVGLRPDPRDVGRRIARSHPELREHGAARRPVLEILRTPAATVAVSAMMLSQVVMAMMTGMVSLDMSNQQHSLTSISAVIAAHTFGMFALSGVVGRLTDRWGRGPVILAGGALLVLSCVLAPLSSNVVPLSTALFLLGVGWNLCYVGGSALLSDQLAPDERAKTQGASDFLMGLATAATTAGSGMLFAAAGYGTLGIVGMAASLVPVLITLWWMVTRRMAAAADSAIVTVAGSAECYPAAYCTT